MRAARPIQEHLVPRLRNHGVVIDSSQTLQVHPGLATPGQVECPKGMAYSEPPWTTGLGTISCGDSVVLLHVFGLRTPKKWLFT